MSRVGPRQGIIHRRQAANIFITERSGEDSSISVWRRRRRKTRCGDAHARDLLTDPARPSERWPTVVAGTALGQDLDARTGSVLAGVVLYEMATATCRFAETRRPPSSTASCTGAESLTRLNPEVPEHWHGSSTRRSRRTATSAISPPGRCLSTCSD